ncbi:MAG TPA: response regulator [Polyangiaceae bacterium LLY-WYZ-15_(1-7)]|nr:response regulator [Polyangiaceae bacterium LLY-WYZ-15_(1-7)]HJL09867.1 response regulator [Polyangiaceae bacterium LLY-WYZ-15_(1-7)]HJL36264.1 response regulator [Polyangiaceae bacterium LLY-WYZ-15_(1-7)]
MSAAFRALVVDDEPGLRLLLERVLERAGGRVTAVATLPEARDWIDAVDVIVCDYRLARGVSGADVVRAAQEKLGALAPPAILVTATPEDVTEEELGLFADWIAKPFRPQAIVDRVRVVLAGRRARQASGTEPRPDAETVPAPERAGGED